MGDAVKEEGDKAGGPARDPMREAEAFAEDLQVCVPIGISLPPRQIRWLDQRGKRKRSQIIQRLIEREMQSCGGGGANDVH